MCVCVRECVRACARVLKAVCADVRVCNGEVRSWGGGGDGADGREWAEEKTEILSCIYFKSSFFLSRCVEETSSLLCTV